MRTEYDILLDTLLEACRLHYGDRLRSLAVFGSVGRGTAKPDSDIDLLIVADGLPHGRIARVDEFRTIENFMRPHLDRAARIKLNPRLSPVFKTPEELERGTPLLLDMTEDARILHDPDHCLRNTLERLTSRLKELGSKRVWRGEDWYWDLKPDYRPGDVFDLFPS